MTITSGEINLQSEDNLIWHLVKVKAATSAHSMADVISFLPPQGFGPEAKTRGGIIVIRAFIIHQIFFARAIGLNTSRDAAKTGEYQMIFPK